VRLLTGEVTLHTLRDLQPLRHVLAVQHFTTI
jgi:hypothetical protein